jgi:carbonic anhydrase/acetyltransferase-like protein (isoleucine patch superfamily)
MLIEHRGKRPTVDPSAYVAPTAVLCGDVRVGPESRILFGAVVSGEDGHGERARAGREAHPVELGDDVLVGPHAHVNGAIVGEGAFLATGTALFPGSSVLPPKEKK